MTDLSKIKPGDSITIRVVTIGTQIGECFEVRVPNANGDRPIYVLASAIVEHHPKALSVGDRVRPRPPTPVISPERGIILHVHNGSAWVEWEPIPTNNDDVQPVYPLKLLERA